jgi:hypothetical protein
MRGCDEDGVGSRAKPDSRSDIETFFIDWNSDLLASRSAHNLVRKPIAGIFHPYRHSWIQQYTCSEIKSLLGSINDEYLRGLTVDTARAPQVSSDDFSEFHEAERISVLQSSKLKFACVPRREA